MPRRLAFSCLVLGSLATASRADWPPAGKYVMGAYNGTYGSRYVALHPQLSGDLYVVAAGTGTNAVGLSVQRVSATGDFEPGWPATGVGLGTVSANLGPYVNGFAVDDSMCFWHARYGGSSFPAGITAHLVQPDGVLRPGTGDWLVHATTGGADAVAGVAGDVYIVCGANRLKRFTRSGTQVPSWPVNGVLFGSSVNPDAALLPDGSGGLLWFMNDGATGFPSVQRVDSTGLVHTGWPSGGIVLSDDPADVTTDLYDQALLRPIVRSGTGHAFAAWTGPRTSTSKQVKLQRFSLDGSLAPGWPASGRLIAAQGAIEGVTLVEDGADGVYVLWYADGLPVGTHVLASGAVQGVPQASLLPKGAEFVRPTFRRFTPGNVPVGYVMADRTPDGRLMFAWDHGSLVDVPSARVRWLLPDLTADPSEPGEGRVIEQAPQGPDRYVRTLRTLHSDGAGGAYVAWEVWQNDPPGGSFGFTEIWMTRILPSHLVGAPGPSPGVPRIALSAPRPNPACDAITVDLALGGDHAVRVQLLDVAGRVLGEQSIAGRGSHVVRFDALDALRPGLYFVRSIAPCVALSRRVILAR